MKVKIKTILKNIRYLSKHRLQDNLEIDNYLDSIKYELDSLPLKPKIKTTEETIDDLITSKKSICRFGDGELQLIKGNNIPFQKASVELSERLKEILSSNYNNVAIAIPRVLYSDLSNINIIGKNFWRANGNKFRSIIEEYINFDFQYYAAECTLCYVMYSKYDHESYFNNIRKIWKDRDITIIHGKDVFKNIKHNIFNNANDIEYIKMVGNYNAFNEYKDLLSSLKNIHRNRLIIAILGSTATVLCYDLSVLGYQALDLGHIVKSYDYFINNKMVTTMNEVVEFFND